MFNSIYYTAIPIIAYIIVMGKIPAGFVQGYMYIIRYLEES